ncbi:MAG TPA: MBL fold metallo-hydrolase [Solirubrobacteraceae bacterium]
MRLIDVRHLGCERVIGAWLVDGVLVDPGPTVAHETLLDGLAGEVPRAIALTHIHLDHAGATGTLTRRWPDAEVWVHERGAPHLADPSRLMASATRLYGDDMDRLWGAMVPVPGGRIRVLPGDGTEVRIGDFRVVATPGHASHHVSYLHEPSATLFAGDTAGVRIGEGPTVGPTPPPDIDLEAWRASLDRLAAWRPDRVVATHFGAFDDPAAQFDALRAWFAEWAPRARDQTQEEWMAAYRAWLGGQVDDATLGSYELAAPPVTLWPGLDRYWRTRDDAAGG